MPGAGFKFVGIGRAVECRLRHRPILLPWSIPVDPPQQALARRAWRSSSRAWSAGGGLFDGLAEIVVAACAHLTPTGTPDLVFVAQVLDCASCRFRRRLSSRGAGKSGARLRLAAALEAAEDGHVAGRQGRRAVRLDEAQNDMRGTSPAWRPWWPIAWIADHVPEKDPRLSFLARVHHVVQGGHRRCVIHWRDMSRNQSRTMGSTWTLRSFAVLPLGSSSTEWVGGGTGSASVGGILVRQRTGDGISWSPTSPAAVSGHHAGGYGGGGMCSCRARSQCYCRGGPLGPHVMKRG